MGQVLLGRDGGGGGRRAASVESRRRSERSGECVGEHGGRYASKRRERGACDWRLAEAITTYFGVIEVVLALKEGWKV